MPFVVDAPFSWALAPPARDKQGLRRTIIVGMASNPPIRRLKTYTGAQGYVYQYYFVGKRPALPADPEAPATEFVFDVTSDRKLTFAVSAFFPDGTRDAWEPDLLVAP